MASSLFSQQPTAFWLAIGVASFLILAAGLVCIFVRRSFLRQKEQLRLETERWSLLLEANQDGIFDVDLRTETAFFSPQWCHQLGYRPAELIPTNASWSERIHPDDRARVETNLADYLERRAAVYDIQYRLRHRAGHWCWIHARAHAVWDENGKAIRLVGSHANVTERNQAATELAASEARLRTFLDNNPALTFIKDEVGRVLYANRKPYENFVGELADLIGKLDEELWPTETAAQLRAADRAAFDSETATECRDTFAMPDGSVHEYLTTRFPFHDSSGRRVLGCVALDVTERRHAEKSVPNAYERLEGLVEERTIELRESEIKWRALVEATPQIVFATGPTGELEYLSPSAVEYTGLPVTELMGGHWLEASHPADRSRISNAWRAALQTGSFYDVEFRLRSKSGEYRWFKTLNSPIRSSAGKIMRWIGTSTDIHDQKCSEEALEAAVARRTLELAEACDRAESASRAKAQFLAAVSHEIRSPMNGVIGMANIILDTELTSQQRCYMDTIRSGGEALLTIINDILDLSKIEAGRLDLEHTQFDLSTVVEESMELVAAQASGKNLKLVCQVDKSVPLDLVGDPIHLRQVILNLLSNAVKFTAEGSVTLRVSCEANQNQLSMLRFAVRDTGIGLTQNQQDNLFQGFQQADLSSRRFGGTGLGLSISKRLVEMMGGSIGVQSQIGEGSTFWFNVCLETAPVMGDLECFAFKHVALISNHPTQASTICSHLEAAGLRVSTYARVPQLDASDFDALLVDHAALPHPPDAGQLCRTTRIPILILGTMADFGSAAVEGLENALFIQKPVRRLPLLRALQSALDGKTPGQNSNASETPSSNRRGTVLLAEDNRINQLVARILLERMGCRVDVVENGVEACTALLRQSYDVVLMDCQMPIMSGFEAAERVRALETSGRRTPIIALTAGVFKEERERCYASGMDDFLSKPISRQNLEAALERWIPVDVSA